MAYIRKRRTAATERDRKGALRYDVFYRDPSGRVRSKTVTTRDEAERVAKLLEADIERGEWRDPRLGTITLSEWIAHWQTTLADHKPRTRESYNRNVRLYIEPTLGRRKLVDINATVLTSWLAGLRARGLAPATVRQAFRVLHSCLAVAVAHEVLVANPCARVTPPKVAKSEMRALTADQLATLVAETDERYRAMVLVGGYCGLRFGELAGLRRQRVDVARRRLQVVEQLQHIGKTYRAKGERAEFVTSTPKSTAGRRVVPMPALVAKTLAEHLEQNVGPEADALVFPAPTGGPLRYRNFLGRTWQPAAARAGLGDFAIHELRHTCASLAIAAGADVKVLQTMLGHSSATLTLDTYGHLMSDRLDAVATRLNATVRGAKVIPSAPVEDLDSRRPRDAREMEPSPKPTKRSRRTA